MAGSLGVPSTSCTPLGVTCKQLACYIWTSFWNETPTGIKSLDNASQQLHQHNCCQLHVTAVLISWTSARPKAPHMCAFELPEHTSISKTETSNQKRCEVCLGRQQAIGKIVRVLSGDLRNADGLGNHLVLSLCGNVQAGSSQQQRLQLKFSLRCTRQNRTSNLYSFLLGMASISKVRSC